MWLTRQLGKTAGPQVSSGEVAGGAQLSIRGEREYRLPETLFPYGFSSLAAGGQKAVMLDGFCAGISALPDEALEEGEVRLYSAGGAEILLKKSGEVIINGRSFPAQ